MLTENGAAQVGRTFDARSVFPDYSDWVPPAGTTLRYQWYSGIVGDGPKYENDKPIAGATGSSYKVRLSDHNRVVWVEARVTDDADRSLRGATRSTISGTGVLYALTKPKMPANLLVGNTVTASFGSWVKDFTDADYSNNSERSVLLTWRRDERAITGHTNVNLIHSKYTASYKLVAADGGKGLSLLAVATHRPLIDRVGQFARVRFRGIQTIAATSPARGQVKVRVTLRTPYLNVRTVRPVVKIYRNSRYLGSIRLIGGVGSKLFKGQPRGGTRMKSVLPTSTLISGSTRTDRVTIR